MIAQSTVLPRRNRTYSENVSRETFSLYFRVFVNSALGFDYGASRGSRKHCGGIRRKAEGRSEGFQDGDLILL